MRALLTGDFRFNLKWFDWLMSRVEDCDLTIYAGDLLDVQNRTPLSQQIARAETALRALVEKRPLAICSGNHDAIDLPERTASGTLPAWLNCLSSYQKAILDGQSKVVQNELTITVLGYLSDSVQKRSQLEIGNRLRQASGGHWLVVHHHPPAFAATEGPEECAAGILLQEFAPTVWCSARYFRQPYRKSFCDQEQIGNTLVLNVAQVTPNGIVKTAPIPNHVVWDLETNQFCWSGLALPVSQSAH